MVVHVLNGDALAQQLMGTYQPFIVMRECLIEGPLYPECNNQFWKQRTDYFIQQFQTEEEIYKVRVIDELDRLFRCPPGTRFHLWFEFDLFCQLNMWFLVDCLVKNYENPVIYWTRPIHRKWSGFGSMSLQDLSKAFDDKLKLKKEEQGLICNLWQNYLDQSMDYFSNLLKEDIPFLYDIDESIRALINLLPGEGLNLPLRKLKTILQESHHPSFGEIFKRFSKELGVYGYGDLQVKHMIDQLQQERV